MSRSFSPLIPPPPNPDAHAELLASLDRLTTFNPPVQTCSTGWTFSGFYAGPTSIALLFYRLSHLYPQLQFKSQSLVDWAEAYIQLGSQYLTPRHAKVDASHCGVGNETLCQLALQSLLTSDSSLALKLCSYASLINAADQEGSNEWLYGRAGYLYILRLVLKLFDPMSDSTRQRIAEATTNTNSRILSCSFPWTWHHRPYLGAVHGSIGIITQILLSAKATGANPQPDVINIVRPYLADILTTQLDSGNFPSSHSSEENKGDRLVQFCHGSPGIVVSLLSIQTFYRSDANIHARISEAIDKAQPDIRARGLLTKAPCLCHGIPTSALAITNEIHAREFCAHMQTKVLEGALGEQLGWLTDAGHSDEYAGLYTGEAGRAWTWAVLEKGCSTPDDQQRTRDITRQGVLGFNDM